MDKELALKMAEIEEALAKRLHKTAAQMARDGEEGSDLFYRQSNISQMRADALRDIAFI